MLVNGIARMMSARPPITSGTAGRRTMRRPQASKRSDVATCAGSLGCRRLASAPAKIGSTVIEEITTAATAIAEPTPILPMSGMPTASRPAMATMTMRPAATTEVPDVAFARAAASGAESPSANCSLNLLKMSNA